MTKVNVDLKVTKVFKDLLGPKVTAEKPDLLDKMDFRDQRVTKVNVDLKVKTESV